MKSEEDTIKTTQAPSIPNNFFIEVLKEGEKFPNEISYFDKQTNNSSIEFSNIQLKIILDKISNLKDKRFLRIDKISESNLTFFFESNLTKQFQNVFICTENKYDLSPYISKINSNKSFLFAMENEFNFSFLNGNKELHIFLENYAAFAACSDIVAKLIGSGLIQSLEFIFKDKDADIYFAPLERLLLDEGNNRNCVAQLILHNRLAEFKKENLESFVNKLLLAHESLRVLKIVGFELSINEEPNAVQEGEEANNNNTGNNENNQNLNNRKSELEFDFDIESILAANKKIKILSVAHDKKINIVTEIDFFEKFYICRLKEFEDEMLACRYLAVVRKNLMPAARFFHRINGFLRKYLVKFFPKKRYEIKSDFANKYINFVNDNAETEMKILPDHVIAKIEKIGFDRSNIKNLKMEQFLEQVFCKKLI